MKLRRSNLLVVWIGSIAVSVFVVVGGYAIGRASDCRPGQIDGQCGLATFIWLLYGIAAGTLIFVGVTVYVIIAAFKRRRTGLVTSGR